MAFNSPGYNQHPTVNTNHTNQPYQYPQPQLTFSSQVYHPPPSQPVVPYYSQTPQYIDQSGNILATPGSVGIVPQPVHSSETQLCPAAVLVVGAQPGQYIGFPAISSIASTIVPQYCSVYQQSCQVTHAYTQQQLLPKDSSQAGSDSGYLSPLQKQQLAWHNTSRMPSSQQHYNLRKNHGLPKNQMTPPGQQSNKFHPKFTPTSSNASLSGNVSTGMQPTGKLSYSQMVARPAPPPLPKTIPTTTASTQCVDPSASASQPTPTPKMKSNRNKDFQVRKKQADSATTILPPIADLLPAASRPSVRQKGSLSQRALRRHMTQHGHRQGTVGFTYKNSRTVTAPSTDIIPKKSKRSKMTSLKKAIIRERTLRAKKRDSDAVNGENITVSDEVSTSLQSEEAATTEQIPTISNVHDEQTVKQADSVDISSKSSDDGIAGVTKKLSPSSSLHSLRFREYCDHLLTKDIDECCSQLLVKLCRFQDKAYQNIFSDGSATSTATSADQLRHQQNKFRNKKRYVCGLRETLRHVKNGRVRLTIVAPNVERNAVEGGLDETLKRIIEECAASSITCVFALSRRTIGKAVQKSVPTTVVGVFDVSGAEQEHKRLLDFVESAREEYQEMKRLADNLAWMRENAESSGTAGASQSGKEAVKPVKSDSSGTSLSSTTVQQFNIVNTLGHSRTPSNISTMSFLSNISDSGSQNDLHTGGASPTDTSSGALPNSGDPKSIVGKHVKHIRAASMTLQVSTKFENIVEEHNASEANTSQDEATAASTTSPGNGSTTAAPVAPTTNGEATAVAASVVASHRRSYSSADAAAAVADETGMKKAVRFSDDKREENVVNGVVSGKTCGKRKQALNPMAAEFVMPSKPVVMVNGNGASSSEH